MLLNGVEMKWHLNGGYVKIGMGKGAVKRSLIICRTFHGEKPLPKAEVAHENDIKTDDRAINLRWATHQENMRDAVRNGIEMSFITEETKKKMSKAHRGVGRKLTRECVEEIRSKWASGDFRQRELADTYGVSRGMIGHIVRGISWSDHVH